MQRSAFSFPDWIHDFIPDDSLFAHAYDDISDRNRALLKTNIARLYDYYGPNKETVTTVSRRWASGLCTETTREVVDFAIILFDASLLSPARLLASLVPALACGVRNVLAVRIADGSTWPTSVLTGLELAGQELVVEFYEAQVRQLFNEIRDGGASGAVTVLGPKAAAVTTNELRAASRISFYRPRFNRAATVWMDAPESFDLEALNFGHPDIIFSVFGNEASLPADNFSHEGDDFDECIEAIMDVAYLPADRMAFGRQQAKLLLGPGQEGCWVWPDLHPDHFLCHTTSWTSGE